MERYDKDGNKDGLRPIDTFAISEVQKEPSSNDTPAICFCNIDEDKIADRLSVDGTYGTHSMSIRAPGPLSMDKRFPTNSVFKPPR